ncbi:hypothetical protein TOPH_01604 [Tolypocladium ophioglossoides CBS 100239]|uniref:Monooxygenase n=1 Tax=Tolypocladium ophioglossoides (strain CBS 100239) TaxID=1163406 RepID=A0A0L0NIU8_TOLOC|nr:hypothetical protein TOPH_01604 [Tolypocladium ophioglossoides CBS 100239]
MGPGFKAKLAPASAPHKFNPKDRYAAIVKTLFTLYPIVLVAAFFQLLFCALLPSDFSVVPSAILLLGYAVTTLIHHLTPSSPMNPYTQHIVPGRATAQLPAPSGSFGTDPGAQGLVVFNLGVQWNHPLGILSPGAKEMIQRFMAMNADLMRRREELGLISINHWKGRDVETASALNITYYFRDVASIHRFAHQELHRKAWDWYHGHHFPHIGIFHETFIVPARSYETIYDNCVPVGLGRGAVRCEDVKGEEQWVNTLVSADTPALKTQMFRLGRGAQGNPKE